MFGEYAPLESITLEFLSDAEIEATSSRALALDAHEPYAELYHTDMGAYASGTTCSNPSCAGVFNAPRVNGYNKLLDGSLHDCPGHFGHIVLPRPILFPLQLTIVQTLLQVFCVECGSFRNGRVDDAVVSCTLLHTRVDRLKFLKSRHANAKTCTECGVANPKVRQRNRQQDSCHTWDRVGLWFPLIAEYDDDDPGSRRLALTGWRAHKALQKIDRDTLVQLRLADTSTDASLWLDTLTHKVLPVSPPVCRPLTVLANGNVTYHCYSRRYRNIMALARRWDTVLKLSFSGATSFGSTTVDETRAENYEAGVTYWFTMIVDNSKWRHIPPELTSRVWVDARGRSVNSRLSKKSGLLRSAVQGKRVEQSARTVITPDPNLRYDEIGFPEYLADVLSVTETVTPRNYDELTAYVQNLDNRILHRMSRRSIIKNQGKTRQLLSLEMPIDAGNLSYGDQVERALRDGDWVVVNRNPSLHKMSMMCGRVRILPGKRLALHPDRTVPFNADFDGDEMNMHAPQSYTSIAECQEFMNFSANAFNPQHGGATDGLVQDGLLGVGLCTRRDQFFTFADAQQLLVGVFVWFPQLHTNFPAPAIAKSPRGPLWTGKQLVSVVLPRTLTYTHIADKDDIADTQDTNVRIVRGELLAGQITKKTVGAGGMSIQLMTLVSMAVSNESDRMEQYKQLYDCLSMIGRTVLTHLGFSVGLDDMVLSRTEALQVRQITQDVERKVEAELQANGLRPKALQLGPTPTARTNSVHNDPDIARDVDTIIKRGSNVSRTHVHPLVVADEFVTEFESKLARLQNSERDKAGALAKKLMLRRTLNNSLVHMATIGSKGSLLNLSQVVACVGLQMMRGRRLADRDHRDNAALTTVWNPMDFFLDTVTSTRNLLIGEKRLLPHSVEQYPGALDGGFARHSFMDGLTPQEFFLHSMASREGLIDTAMQTKDTGYAQRRMIKCMEDLVMEHDGSVRNSQGVVVTQEGWPLPERCRSYTVPELMWSDDKVNDVFVWEDASTYQLNTIHGYLRRLRQLTALQKTFHPTFSVAVHWDWILEHIVANDPFVRDLRSTRKGVRNPSVLRDDDLNALDWSLAAYERLRQSCVRLGLSGVWCTRQDATDMVDAFCERVVATKLMPDEVHRILTALRCNTKVLLMRACLTKPALSTFLHACEQAFWSAKAPAGTATGIVTAQSVGGQYTQLTLNTFHFAGTDAAHVDGKSVFKQLLNGSEDRRKAQTTIHMSEARRSAAVAAFIATRDKRDHSWFSMLGYESCASQWSDLCERVEHVNCHDAQTCHIAKTSPSSRGLAIAVRGQYGDTALAAIQFALWKSWGPFAPFTLHWSSKRSYDACFVLVEIDEHHESAPFWTSARLPEHVPRALISENESVEQLRANGNSTIRVCFCNKTQRHVDAIRSFAENVRRVRLTEKRREDDSLFEWRLLHEAVDVRNSLATVCLGDALVCNEIVYVPVRHAANSSPVSDTHSPWHVAATDSDDAALVNAILDDRHVFGLSTVDETLWNRLNTLFRRPQSAFGTHTTDENDRDDADADDPPDSFSPPCAHAGARADDVCPFVAKYGPGGCVGSFVWRLTLKHSAVAHIEMDSLELALIEHGLVHSGIAQVVDRDVATGVVVHVRLRLCRVFETADDNDSQSELNMLRSLSRSSHMLEMRLTGAADTRRTTFKVESLPSYDAASGCVRKRDEVVFYTDSADFLYLCTHPDLDGRTLSSNLVSSMANTFGARVARATLIRQFEDTARSAGSKVHRQHFSTIADAMFYTGEWRGFQWSHLRHCTNDILQLASYERTFETFARAATNCTTNPITTASCAVATGRTARRYGTGTVRTFLDVSKLADAIEVPTTTNAQAEVWHPSSSAQSPSIMSFDTPALIGGRGDTTLLSPLSNPYTMCTEADGAFSPIIGYGNEPSAFDDLVYDPSQYAVEDDSEDEWAFLDRGLPTDNTSSGDDVANMDTGADADMSPVSPAWSPVGYAMDSANAAYSGVSYSPTSPTYSPTSPAYSPTSPSYTPTSPAYSPTSPSYTPTSPAYSPTSPSYTPTSPAYSPTSPSYTPTPPVYSPTAAVTEHGFVGNTIVTESAEQYVPIIDMPSPHTPTDSRDHSRTDVDGTQQSVVSLSVDESDDLSGIPSACESESTSPRRGNSIDTELL